MLQQRKSKAFTLIELLVVVSIIALLVSILLPALNRAREQAKRVVCAANLHSIGVGISTYASDNSGLIPEPILMTNVREGITGYSPNSAIYPYLTFWMYRLDDYNSPHVVTKAYNLAPLYDSGIISAPEVFYCPGLNANSSVVVNNDGDTVQMFTWEAYKHPGETWPAPEMPQRRAYGVTRISYNYFPQSKNARYSPAGISYLNFSCPKYTNRFSDLSAQYALVTDFLYTYEALPHQFNGEATGINVLFGDTHVAWSQEQEAFDWLTTQGSWSDAPGPFYQCISLLRP